MKKLFLVIILIVCSLGLKAQGESDEDSKDFLLKTRAVDFSGEDLNTANATMSQFITTFIHLAEVDDKIVNKDTSSYVEYTFKKRISSQNVNDNKMKLRYNCKMDNGNFIIKNVLISGYYEYVVDFFVQYFQTTLDITAKKNGEIATRNTPNDIATLYVDISKSYAKIIIKRR